MLAALIATRQPAPPPPPVFFYTNQLVAATNTFVCITVCRRTAFICTNPTIRIQLSLSLQGSEAILDQLNRYYYRIINYLSSNANIISMPSDLYLSTQIAGVIASATTLTSILAVLPVTPQNQPFLSQLQRELAVALANLRALGAPV